MSDGQNGLQGQDAHPLATGFCLSSVLSEFPALGTSHSTSIHGIKVDLAMTCH